ncbi:hypothetical protein BESB_003130 [Besnoitia besnoiti]|uniref:Myb-like domain-containing protein n=1 Tax=Besnoitia besnoiti TaxID=94643 RepID=A0A2A9MQ02_BESBE|nr:hypothetical protein BESB_003130 [Besnoitia besnoiti]PFH37972.1 hypothetical protein BESB_003130 [Besnoitia besnoiti]
MDNQIPSRERSRSTPCSEGPSCSSYPVSLPASSPRPSPLLAFCCASPSRASARQSPFYASSALALPSRSACAPVPAAFSSSFSAYLLFLHWAAQNLPLAPPLESRGEYLEGAGSAASGSPSSSFLRRCIQATRGSPSRHRCSVSEDAALSNRAGDPAAPGSGSACVEANNNTAAGEARNPDASRPVTPSASSSDAPFSAPAPPCASAASSSSASLSSGCPPEPALPGPPSSPRCECPWAMDGLPLFEAFDALLVGLTEPLAAALAAGDTLAFLGFLRPLSQDAPGGAAQHPLLFPGFCRHAAGQRFAEELKTAGPEGAWLSASAPASSALYSFGQDAHQAPRESMRSYVSAAAACAGLGSSPPCATSAFLRSLARPALATLSFEAERLRGLSAPQPENVALLAGEEREGLCARAALWGGRGLAASSLLDAEVLSPFARACAGKAEARGASAAPQDGLKADEARQTDGGNETQEERDVANDDDEQGPERCAEDETKRRAALCVYIEDRLFLLVQVASLKVAACALTSATASAIDCVLRGIPAPPFRLASSSGRGASRVSLCASRRSSASAAASPLSPSAADTAPKRVGPAEKETREAGAADAPDDAQHGEAAGTPGKRRCSRDSTGQLEAVEILSKEKIAFLDQAWWQLLLRMQEIVELSRALGLSALASSSLLTVSPSTSGSAASASEASAVSPVSRFLCAPAALREKREGNLEKAGEGDGLPEPAEGSREDEGRGEAVAASANAPGRAGERGGGEDAFAKRRRRETPPELQEWAALERDVDTQQKAREEDADAAANERMFEAMQHMGRLMFALKRLRKALLTETGDPLAAVIARKSGETATPAGANKPLEPAPGHISCTSPQRLPVSGDATGHDASDELHRPDVDAAEMDILAATDAAIEAIRRLCVSIGEGAQLWRTLPTREAYERLLLPQTSDSPSATPRASASSSRSLAKRVSAPPPLSPLCAASSVSPSTPEGRPKTPRASSAAPWPARGARAAEPHGAAERSSPGKGSRSRDRRRRGLPASSCGEGAAHAEPKRGEEGGAGRGVEQAGQPSEGGMARPGRAAGAAASGAGGETAEDSRAKAQCLSAHLEGLVGREKARIDFQVLVEENIFFLLSHFHKVASTHEEVITTLDVLAKRGAVSPRFLLPRAGWTPWSEWRRCRMEALARVQRTVRVLWTEKDLWERLQSVLRAGWQTDGGRDETPEASDDAETETEAAEHQDVVVVTDDEEGETTAAQHVPAGAREADTAGDGEGAPRQVGAENETVYPEAAAEGATGECAGCRQVAPQFRPAPAGEEAEAASDSDEADKENWQPSQGEAAAGRWQPAEEGEGDLPSQEKAPEACRKVQKDSGSPSITAAESAHRAARGACSTLSSAAVSASLAPSLSSSRGVREALLAFWSWGPRAQKEEGGLLHPLVEQRQRDALRQGEEAPPAGAAGQLAHEGDGRARASGAVSEPQQHSEPANGAAEEELRGEGRRGNEAETRCAGEVEIENAGAENGDKEDNTLEDKEGEEGDREDEDGAAEEGEASLEERSDEASKGKRPGADKPTDEAEETENLKEMNEHEVADSAEAVSAAAGARKECEPKRARESSGGEEDKASYPEDAREDEDSGGAKKRRRITEDDAAAQKEEVGKVDGDERAVSVTDESNASGLNLRAATSSPRDENQLGAQTQQGVPRIPEAAEVDDETALRLSSCFWASDASPLVVEDSLLSAASQRVSAAAHVEMHVASAASTAAAALASTSHAEPAATPRVSSASSVSSASISVAGAASSSSASQRGSAESTRPRSLLDPQAGERREEWGSDSLDNSPSAFASGGARQSAGKTEEARRAPSRRRRERELLGAPEERPAARGGRLGAQGRRGSPRGGACSKAERGQDSDDGDELRDAASMRYQKYRDAVGEPELARKLLNARHPGAGLVCRTQRKWMAADEQLLVAGVNLFGIGKWNEVHKFFPPLRRFTPPQLKDKFRTLRKLLHDSGDTYRFIE